MVVRLRLSPHRLFPTSREKVYHIVACNAPRARDSKPLETVGIYDPIPRRISAVPYRERSLLDEGKMPESQLAKRIEWDKERIKYWIGVGAQPTPRVAWLMSKVCRCPALIEALKTDASHLRAG